MEALLHQENSKQENDSQSLILVGLDSTKAREQWTLKVNLKWLARIVNSTLFIVGHILATEVAVIEVSLTTK